MSKDITHLTETKKFHKRNNSGELDVFEAARYFSGVSENFTDAYSCVNDKIKIHDTTHVRKDVGRMSLDMPINRRNSIPLQEMMMESSPNVIKKEKYKQPSSPGGRLAHFLNSLFNQTSSKKSKSKSKSKSKPTTTKDEDESPSGWRRKRRSSISHFRSGNSNSTTITTTTKTIVSDSKSLFSTSSNSGFRTPPPCHLAQTPTKINGFPNLKAPCEVTKTPMKGNLNKNGTLKTKSEIPEKKRSFGNGFVEKVSEEGVKNFKNFIEDDDGGDSDSSSDLFELRNCDLGYYSSGLPVYETTHMDSIRRGAPISS